MEINMVKNLKPAINIGPGDIIKDRLQELGWSQNDLADIIGMTVKNINFILNNKYAISFDTARLLASVFGTSPEFWLNLDMKYRLNINDTTVNENEVAIKAKIRKHMPLRDMRKKGWVAGDNSTQGIIETFKAFWGVPEVTFTMYTNSPVTLCARQLACDEDYTKNYSITWLHMARKSSSRFTSHAPYSEKALRSIAESLPDYMNQTSGIMKFIKDLNNCGVKFFVLSHLEKTYLDGACFIEDETPVIVYTARHNKDDNFWFTMAHEIAHVVQHLKTKNDYCLDNFDDEMTSVQEREADEMACAWLRKNLIIKSAKAKRIFGNIETISRIAKECGVSVGFVVGVLQYNRLLNYSTRLNGYKFDVTQYIDKDYFID